MSNHQNECLSGQVTIASFEWITGGEMAQKVIEWDMKSYAWEIDMAQFKNGPFLRIAYP